MTLIDESPGQLAPTVKFAFAPDTFLAVRIVVSRPGSTGALIDGRLRSTACTGSALSAA